MSLLLIDKIQTFSWTFGFKYLNVSLRLNQYGSIEKMCIRFRPDQNGAHKEKEKKFYFVPLHLYLHSYKSLKMSVLRFSSFNFLHLYFSLTHSTFTGSKTFHMIFFGMVKNFRFVKFPVKL